MSRALGLLFILLFTVSGAFADSKCDLECPDCNFEALTADIHCGKRNAFNLMARLPATRIVVYDPMSNSFAFVSPCAEELGGQASATMDRLDVQRLVLPTQKIRLLIMPHDPLFEELQLEVTPGSGIEFEPSPFSIRAGEQLVPLTTGRTTPPGENDDEEDEEDDGEEEDEEESEDTGAAGAGTGGTTATNTAAGSVPQPQVPAAGTRSTESQSALGELSTKGLEGLSADQREAIQDELPRLNIGWARYVSDQALLSVRRLLDEAFIRHQQNITHKNCISDGVSALPMRASEALNAQAKQLPVTRDLRPQEVALEACRRTRAIKRIKYESTCFDGGGTFQMDVDSLRRLLSEERKVINQLPGLIEIARQSIVVLESKITALPDKQGAPFRPELANFKATLQSLEAAKTAALKEYEELADTPEELIENHTTIVSSLYSPAVHLQRFNFNPLGNGEALTFRIWRGEPQTGDDARDAIPARKNSLTLKSAPALVIRFGAGLVASRLEAPEFETIPIPAKSDSDPNDGVDDSTPAMKRITFRDENDQRVFPGVFIHHYWGRRSPLLAPTAYERFVPTFSLGVPLTDAAMFEHLLLGLDWELVPGFELNLGAHLGKRKELASGYKVGQEIPDTLDLTELIQTDSDWAVYFGIVLNASSFDTLLRRNGNNP